MGHKIRQFEGVFLIPEENIRLAFLKFGCEEKLVLYFKQVSESVNLLSNKPYKDYFWGLSLTMVCKLSIVLRSLKLLNGHPPYQNRVYRSE